MKKIVLVLLLSIICLISFSFAQNNKSNISNEQIEIVEKRELLVLPEDCQHYAVSNNQTIAYVDQKGRGYGTKTICIIYKSGESKRIIKKNCKVFHLKFSPDNKWLSYGIREINGVGKIILHNLIDGIFLIIENGDKECGNLDFSPDSKKFLYTKYLEQGKTRNMVIVIRDFAEGETIIAHNANHGKWSPKGDKIAFSRVEPASNSRRWTSFIWIYDFQDNNEIKLNNSQDISTGTISWSFLGNKICGKTNTKLGIIDIIKDTVIEIGELGANSPMWIKNASKVIFEQPYYKPNSNGEIIDSELFVVNYDGSGLTNFTNTPKIKEKTPINYSNQDIIYYSIKNNKVQLTKIKIKYINKIRGQ